MPTRSVPEPCFWAAVCCPPACANTADTTAKPLPTTPKLPGENIMSNVTEDARCLARDSQGAERARERKGLLRSALALRSAWCRFHPIVQVATCLLPLAPDASHACGRRREGRGPGSNTGAATPTPPHSQLLRRPGFPRQGCQVSRGAAARRTSWLLLG